MTITKIKEDDKYQMADLVPEEYLYGAENTCICAVEEEEICGVISAAIDEDRALEIRYIFIAPEHRGQKLATSLFQMLSYMARSSGICSFTANFVRQGKEDELSLFFKANGFELIEESGLFSIDLSMADSSLEKEGIWDIRVCAVNRVTRTEWNDLCNILMEKRIKNNREGGKAIYIVPDDREKYDTDLSQIAFDDRGRPAGVILIRQTSDGLNIDYLCNLRTIIPQISVVLMKTACDAAAEKYPEIKVYFHAYNPAAEKMARKYFGRFLKDEGRAEYYIKYL